MSWYTDPELFIYHWGSSQGYWIARIEKKFNVPLVRFDIRDVEKLDFCKYFSLGYNEECDYDALKTILAKYSVEVNRSKVMHVNCQGLVVYWNYNAYKSTWSWEEEISSIINSLPGINTNSYEKQVVEKKNSELVAEISSLKDLVTSLQEQLNQEKNDRQVQVSGLTTKLKEYRRADAEPWMSCTVPSHWVPFEELDVLNIPENTPLKITEAPEFGEDTTTNVQPNRFCQGIIPVVVVNVADLNPNRGKARFDPGVWRSLNNAGNRYAARSFDPQMR